MFNKEQYQVAEAGKKISREIDAIPTEIEQDIYFLKNIRHINWRHSEQERAKRLKKEGLVVYVRGIHCGYWDLTNRAKLLIFKT